MTNGIELILRRAQSFLIN